MPFLWAVHICCWIGFLQHCAKMTKCSITHITEVSFWGRRISMEFALYTKGLWPWFCKRRKHKNLWPQSYTSCGTWEYGMCFWCRTIINWLSTYTSNRTTRHSSVRLSLVRSRSVKENSCFWRGVEGNMLELIVYGCGLQVFILLPHVLRHIPIVFWELVHLRLGKEYHLWLQQR